MSNKTGFSELKKALSGTNLVARKLDIPRFYEIWSKNGDFVCSLTLSENGKWGASYNMLRDDRDCTFNSALLAIATYTALRLDTSPPL